MHITIHLYVTTIGTSLPSVRHYHLYVTTICMSLPSVCHYHLYVTTIGMSLPSVCHYHLYVTTICMSRPSVRHDHLYACSIHHDLTSICRYHCNLHQLVARRSTRYVLSEVHMCNRNQKVLTRCIVEIERSRKVHRNVHISPR